MKQANSDLLNKIIDFAKTQKDIQFLGLIGSSSNGESLDDEYSDIDLVLVTDSLKRYFAEEEWLSSIDEVWVTFIESAADINYWERRCVFSNGLDVDFVIVDKEKLLDTTGAFPVLHDICRKTMKVLLDKDNYKEQFTRFMNTGRKQYTDPTQEEYCNLVNDFYFHYLWSYKKCLRGEYWVALQCVNNYLKSKTLSMIEWYEHALHGNEYHTFYQGRFIEKWIDEPIKKELETIYSAYGKENIISALDANMHLFTRLAKMVGESQKFDFPEKRVDKLINWVRTNYKDRG